MIRFSSQIFNIIGIVFNEENEESAMKCRVLFSVFQVKTVVKRLLFFYWFKWILPVCESFFGWKIHVLDTRF